MAQVLPGIARRTGITLLALIVCAPPALALDAVRQGTLNLRQVKVCMVKRMLADRTLSYNDAKKTCADQMSAQSNAAVQAPAPALAAAGRQGG